MSFVNFCYGFIIIFLITFIIYQYLRSEESFVYIYFVHFLWCRPRNNCQLKSSNWIIYPGTLVDARKKCKRVWSFPARIFSFFQFNVNRRLFCRRRGFISLKLSIPQPQTKITFPSLTVTNNNNNFRKTSAPVCPRIRNNYRDLFFPTNCRPSIPVIGGPWSSVCSRSVLPSDARHYGRVSGWKK